MSTARRWVPLLVLPLALVLCGVASAPWLRAFPADVAAVPLFGTALLSVLLPVVVVAIGVRPLWLTALIDLAGFVFFTTLITLQEPLAVGQLWQGLTRGPSELLTFALPLVSPRTLLVAPVALCWLCGAVIGETIARGWRSVLPYAAALVTFGLSYAATTRAISGTADGRRYDTLLAGLLLVVMLLLRAVKTWLAADPTDETGSGARGGGMPPAALARGSLLAVAVAGIASLVVQTGVFAGPATPATRVPPLDTAAPVNPLSFVAGLRPADPTASGRRLFTVSFNRTASRYVAVADVDTYDGDSWTFTRQFRPSGGVVPADTDPSLRPGGSVTQRYTVQAGLADVAWLPFQYRPRDVDGVAVDIDPASGMIVPRQQLAAGQSYVVRSTASAGDVEDLPSSALVATSAPPAYTFLPLSVRRSIGTVVSALRNETRSTSSPPLAFLQALTTDLRANYALSGSERAPRTGGTGFAGVLASILGPARAATPEQYATLVALVARAVGVPARVVTGFRVGSGSDDTVDGGVYEVRAQAARTWVEIPVDGRGWVVLDAAPDRYGSVRPPASAAASPVPTPSPTPTNALVTQAPSNAGNAVAPRSDVPGSTAPSTTQWLLLAGAVVLVVLLVVALLVGRKRRRIRARRRGDPRRQVIGAWQETLDVLSESGVAGLGSLTSDEVADRAATTFGAETAESTRAVGAAADRAIFAPSAPIEPATAVAAWRGQAEVVRRIRRTQTGPQRLRSRVRYHHASGGRSAAKRH